MSVCATCIFVWRRSSYRQQHRKEWIVERLSTLSRVFAIEIGSYAIMSNHYHLVLRINEEEGLAWCDKEVTRRWKKIYSWPLLVQEYLKGNGSVAERAKAQEIIQVWRERLCDLSWYMRCLNEYLARKANKEDHCTGRFWEGRYKCQALLDDAAVLTCMSYVDLNPVRARVADTPEDSNYTSIQQRINKLKHKSSPAESSNKDNKFHPVRLMALIKSDKNPHAIGFTTKDYLELVDWAGRTMRDDKRGSISDAAPPILKQLGLDMDEFINHVNAPVEKQAYPRVLGPFDKIKCLAEKLQQKFIRNQSYALKLYKT